MDIFVNSVGFPLADLVKYLHLVGYNLEMRMIPRYRLMDALKSMQVLKTERSFPQVRKTFLGKIC